MKTTGKKGETIKQIVLEKVHPDLIGEATPEKVLSEGEKRAVALADFLTEVALDTESHGIVLDDPVTSLDWEWRDKIAQIVANEAVHRQVIRLVVDDPFEISSITDLVAQRIRWQYEDRVKIVW